MSNELDTDLSSLELSGEISFLEETGYSLSDKVMRKIQDGSYSWTDIVDEFNACLDYLSGQYDLPQLEHTEDVTTDSNSNRIPVPANFQKKLLMCRSITHNRPCEIKDTVVNLFRLYTVLDQTGAVRRVSIKGRYLYYQRLAEETLRLVYYRYPNRLRTRWDKPSCLPPHLVEPLLINYACKEIFSEIEDGVEGPQVNTQRYTDRFARAEEALVKWIGPQRREPVDFPEEIPWDAYV